MRAALHLILGAPIVVGLLHALLTAALTYAGP